MMRSEGSTQPALVSWTRGQCSFTAAGLVHYEAACAQAHLVFAPQAIHTTRDFCRFLRALLQAGGSPATRADGARQLRSLARRALEEVASCAHPHQRPGLPLVADATPCPTAPDPHGRRTPGRTAPDAQACAAE